MDNLFDIELERLVVGACLVNLDAFRDVSSMLDVSDFGFVENQLVFRAIKKVFEDNQTVDPVLVCQLLKKQGELNRVGGVLAIHDLHASIAEIKSTRFYCQLLKEVSVKRHINNICLKAKNRVLDESLTAGEIIAEITSEIDNVTGVSYQIQSMTARELMEMDIPEVKWVIPDLIPSGLTILAGDAKIGKSFFAWNIALAVACGGIALSEFRIEKPRNVTYLALEDPPALLKDRIKMITEYSDIPSNLHIINHLPFKFDNAGLKILEQHIEDTQSDLVIVDTWKHVCPEAIYQNGSAYDVDYQTLIPVQNFTHTKNIAMMLVTHTRKTSDVDNVFNQIQGSMGIQAGCDTLMMLTRNSGAHSLHITGRRIIQEEYAMTMTDGIWKLEGSAADYNVSTARLEILQHLYDAGEDGLQSGDIVEIAGKQRAAVQKMLRTMLSEGQVKQPKKRGAYLHPEFYQNGASNENPSLLDDIPL